MAFTAQQEIDLKALVAQPTEIVSDLESSPALTGDMLIPIENGTGTFAASLDDIKTFVAPQATESTAGIAKIATQAITNTGTNDTDFLTALKLANATSIIKLGTAVTASGTSVDFTGIPAGVKFISINFSGLSTNGTSQPIIQLGDSGGIETSGYLGASSGMGAGVTTNNFTTGFALGADTIASAVRQGSVFLELIDSTNNTWVASGTNSRSDVARTDLTGGSKSTSAILDRVRITTVNGTDTFDAGTINIQYQ
jgi:hypothetical protein